MIVKLLSENNGTALIEWLEDGELQRAIVPAREVSEGGECVHPERGLPYGLNLPSTSPSPSRPPILIESLKMPGYGRLMIYCISLNLCRGPSAQHTERFYRI